MEEVLRLEHITKTYPGVRALDDVSISVRKGEVHALLGENGAGKSTLIKVLSGAVIPDSGKIVFDGKEYDHLTPAQALEAGIAVVYQELNQMESMTVADNIFAGEKSRGRKTIDDKARYARTQELLDQFHSKTKPTDIIGKLSMGSRQIVEIAKAVNHNAKIIVMDEPTSSITVEDQKTLVQIINQLKAKGVTIIYISHRLEELFEVCDRVSILRDGTYVKTVDIAQTEENDLIRLMVGRELSEIYPELETPSEEVVLKVDHLSGNGVSDISFELHKGEILGFAGLIGAGRTELMSVLYGAARKESGMVSMNGKPMEARSTAESIRAGIGLVPEDRKGQGCLLEKPIFWNISLSCLPAVSKGIVIDRKQEAQLADNYKNLLKIKTPDTGNWVNSLSGGNQQKVAIAKALAAEPQILIFDEPTRGVDVGARYEIYTAMVNLTKQGKSILMVSSDMEELLGMANRIIVLHEGQQMGELRRGEFSQDEIMRMASGIKKEEA